MAYQVTYEENGIYYKCSGTVCMSELGKIHSLLHQHKNPEKVNYYIIDGLDIEKLDITIKNADIPATMDAKSPIYSRSTFKAALIATNSYIKEAIQRYINTSKKQGNPWSFAMFETLEEARKWIEE